MYEFIDVDHKQPNAPFPAEALKINGNYIENLIDGYRTLYVEGRELLPSELIGNESDTKDGFIYRGRRYPERRITVTYQLVQKSSYEFRDAFNMLNGILCKENSELIFNDEPDMYFIGTLEGVDSVEPGTNNTVGSFSFICADPFKYSVNKTVLNIEKGKNIFDVNYRGTHKAYPTLIIKPTSDLGYVEFTNEHGGLLQIGNPSEVDGNSEHKTETLINQKFTSAEFNSKEWTKNNAIPVNTSRSWAQRDDVAIRDDMLVSPSYSGSGELFGPSITRKIPPDSNGKTGAKNWELTWTSMTSYHSNNQFGDLEILVTGMEKGVRKNIAGFCCFRLYSGNACFGNYGYGKALTEEGYEGYHADSYKGNLYSYSILKFGSTLEFITPKGTYVYTVPEIENLEATEVSILFGMYKNTSPMDFGVKNIMFKNHAVDTWIDIPNQFGRGDVIKIDCEKGDIFLNGVENHKLGSAYNTWDEFYLETGNNRLNVGRSSWASDPEISVEYRKAML